MIDLRSDTVTRPTAAMRDAMFSAPLGDDVFGDDPSVLALQGKAAALLGKEAALYVPSGTMSNQLALRVHTRHGDEVITHKKSHIFNYESGAPAALAGVTIQHVDSADGTLPIDAVEAVIHQTDDPHFAVSSLIALENTHNGAGGCVVPMENVREITTLGRSKGLALHLDGARLFNATVAMGIEAATMAAPFDTVSICLSKGLGCPVGSLLVGSKAQIAIAYRFRKMYGGGMRQAGLLAAAGIYALDHNIERLADDHRRARALAEGLNAMPGLSVDLERVHTNLVYFNVDSEHPLSVLEDGIPRLTRRLEAAGILIVGTHGRYRAALHLDVSDDDLQQTLDGFKRVLSAA